MREFNFRTLRENITSAIRQQILDGELEPGSKLVEQQLAAEFGSSRGPIREALRQLEQEGLVEYSRNVGCSVKSITIDDAYEIYLLRATLEIAALREYDCQFPADDLAAMRGIMDRMLRITPGDLAAIVELDKCYHRIIVQRAHLPRLLQLWDDLNYGSLIAGAKSGPYHDDLATRQHVIHTELYEVLERRDTEAACKAIYDHYMKPFAVIRAADQDSTSA